MGNNLDITDSIERVKNQPAASSLTFISQAQNSVHIQRGHEVHCGGGSELPVRACLLGARPSSHIFKFNVQNHFFLSTNPVDFTSSFVSPQKKLCCCWILSAKWRLIFTVYQQFIKESSTRFESKSSIQDDWHPQSFFKTAINSIISCCQMKLLGDGWLTQNNLPEIIWNPLSGASEQLEQLGHGMLATGVLWGVRA